MSCSCASCGRHLRLNGAIGAIDESGWTYLSPHFASLGVADRYLEEEKQHQLEVPHARRNQYAVVRPPADPAGRIAVASTSKRSGALCSIASPLFAGVGQISKRLRAL